MAQTLAKAVCWIVVLFVVGAFGLSLWENWSSGRFVSVPNGHDPRLVGRWSGAPQPRWAIDLKMPQKMAIYDLRADGTGTMSNRGSFIWGTEGGKIQFKYLAVDYWAHPTFSYQVAADGGTFRISPEHSYQFAPVWTRVP